jgi:hypothetical protein
LTLTSGVVRVRAGFGSEGRRRPGVTVVVSLLGHVPSRRVDWRDLAVSVSLEFKGSSQLSSL